MKTKRSQHMTELAARGLLLSRCTGGIAALREALGSGGSNQSAHCTVSRAIGCRLVLDRWRSLQAGLGSGPHSWLGDSCLVTVPSHGLCPVRAQGKRTLPSVPHLLWQQSYQLPTLMISLNFITSLKTLSPLQPH